MFKIIFLSIPTLALILDAIQETGKISNRVNKFIYFFSIGLLLNIVFAFRAPGVGLFYDYQSYKIIFSTSNLQNLFNVQGGSEFGFNFLCYIIRLIFGNNYCIFLFICGTIILIGLFAFINAYSSCIWLSTLLAIFMGGYFTSYNILRQWIAIVIYLNLIKFILLNDTRKFVIGCLLASTIHFSCLILIPFYFLFNAKNKKVIALCIAVLILSIFTPNILINFIPQIGKLENLKTTAVAEGNSLRTLIKQIVILLFYQVNVFEKLINLNDETDRFFYMCTIFSLVMAILGINYPIIQRMSHYFMVPSIVAIPTYIYRKYYQSTRLGYILIWIVMALVYANAGTFKWEFSWIWG